MRILTRYILREILSHALIGAALFTFVVFMRDIARVMEIVVRNSAPATAVAQLFLFTLPTALTITIPMGVLVGVLLGLSRLAADSEITAMRATGMGAWHFVRVVAIFAVVAWALALFNNVYVAPHSAGALARLQDRLKNSQASFEIQPRVFYEDFKNYVLYVQDVSAARGAAEWRGIFLADISTPGQPKVTLAKSGIVTPQGESELRLDLQNGEQHSLVEGKAGQYEITTFSESNVVLQLPNATQPQRETVPTAEISTPELLRLSRDSEPGRARWYRVEYHRRLALPAACIVLALVGVPLGLSARKGGKSTGFVLTIGLVFVYYFISLLGVSLGRQGKVSPGVGVWLSNVIFFLTGAVLLFHADKRPLDAGGWLRSELAHARAWLRRKWRRRISQAPSFEPIAARRRILWTSFPQILDDYIVRDFLAYAGMMLGAFVVLMLVFTFFELIRDLSRAGWTTVGEYLLDSVPSLIYLLLPLAVLVAVLVTFGLMSRANEITAMKATGISIYRIVLPVVIIAGLLAAGQFLFEQRFLPRFNRRQETLHNRIKGKPPQTYLNPGRKWIFGEHHSIYYYQFFDPDRGEFGNVSVFEFDPDAFQITKRVYARRAHWESGLSKWVFEGGWERQFRGSAIEKYRTYDVSAFDELNEPPTYFRKERQSSSEMSYAELKSYIHDLQQSGFDVVRLKVQLQKKIAFPLITLVMAILAIPFSLTGGRRGALTGVATAISIAVVYWVSAGVFEAMGNLSQLPPLLAAWSPDILFALGGGYLLLKVQT